MSTALMVGCGAPEKAGPAELATGRWRAVLRSPVAEIPFELFAAESEDGFVFAVENAEERLELGLAERFGDSLAIPMHVFNAEIRAKLSEDGRSLSGFYVKKDYADYRIPFVAEAGEAPRFEGDKAALEPVEGRWATAFTEPDGDGWPAIGEFRTVGGQVYGTFLTETGDYRFLEGTVLDVEGGPDLRLSTFDGEHAFLFTGKVMGDSIADGKFFSGKHGEYGWTARRDPDARLADPESLTYLKEGYGRFDFAFPNLEGDTVSLGDERFQGKAVVVQLLGSWCPNCMDETRFLARRYETVDRSSLEFVGLAFERKDDFGHFRQRVGRLKEKLDAGYPMLFAGVSDKERAAEALPMLNAVIAYPTTIFIDKTGSVRRIHTGFSGPGTGRHYEEYVAEFDSVTNALAQEAVPLPKQAD